MFKPLSLFVVLAALLAASFPGSASASNFGGCVDLGGTISVNTTTDEFNTGANCSLREAIQGANDVTNVGARTINLPAGTYTLSIAGTGDDANVSGDLDSTRATTIVGAGARTTTISANSIDRVFDISATGNLTMSGVTVRQGSQTANNAIAGGVRVLASGTFSLTDSTVTANSTTGNSGHGAGINNAGTLSLTRVLVSGNSTSGNGTMGAGIYTTTGNASLTNVTITGNTQPAGSSSPTGAGMRVDGGTATLTNVTITNNTARSASDVAGISRGGGTASLRNTVVATQVTGVNCGGTITNTANNLDSGTTCGFTTLNGSKSSAAPALGALANNGGPTDTHSIPSDPTVNPARDAGTATSAPTNDQRGAGRDAIPDMGAYEACGVSPTVTNPGAQSVTYGTNAVFTAAASGRGTVQWEVSTSGAGGPWNPVAGGTSPTLTLTKPAVSQTGNLYRANFTGTGCTGTVTTTSASLTVTQKNLTISGAVANSRAYNQTTTATVNFGSATLVGVESGDTVTIDSSAYSANFNNKDVGNGKPVTVTGVALSGAQAANYTVSQPSGLTANITAKALTLSGAVAQNKVYNATTAATVDFTSASLNGVESGETVTINSSGYSASFNNKNVGNSKPVTVSGVTLGGADAGNYTLTQPSLTADITKKDTTGSFTANNKPYDGNTSATINTATVDAKETGDTVNLTGTATFDNKNVGNGKTVTLNSPSLTGADAGNYNLTTVSTTTANITAKNLTISGAVAQNKVYDATTAATVNFGGASLNGVVSGETVTIDSSGYSASFNNKNVGNSKPVTVSGVTLGGADAGSYTVSQPTGLTANITAKGLTITGAVAQNKIYNATTAATVSFTGASLNGVESGDTVTINSSAYSASFANKNVGTGKPVTVTGVALAGADAANYTVSQPTGLTADITKKDTTGSFTANNKTYDGTNSATIKTQSVDGKISGDTVNLTGTPTFDNKNVGNNKTVTLNSPSLTGTDAGNYNLTTVATTDANISRKTLTISGAVAQNKVYNATTAATVDFTGASLNGVETVDAGQVGFNAAGYSASFNNKNVGTGKTVSVSGVTLTGAESGNYNLSQPSLTANITKKDTTGSFTANNKVYDGTDNATINTATVDGKIVGDTVNLTGTAKFADKNVGTGKTVTLTSPSLTGTDAGNYNLTTVSTTTADITKKGLTISGAQANSKEYNGNATATVDFTGASLNVVESGDTVTIDSSGYSASFDNKNVGTTKPVTVTGVALGGADAGNYSVSQPTGLTADITEKTLTVSGAQADNKVYDGNADATIDFTGASLSGVESGDTVSLDSSGSSASFDNKSVGNGKPVTVTGVALSGADAGNYTVTPPTGLTADITKKDTTGSFTANNKVYDGTDDATIDTATVDGKESGDDVELTGTAKFDNKNAGTGKTVTLTSPSLTGADAGNYNLTTVATTTADITKKGLTISGAQADNRAYNGNTNATVDFTGASLTGVESGDAVTIDSSGYSASFDTKDVGTGKPVSVTGVALGGADAGNYSVSQPTGLTADITEKTLTISGAVANNKPYDGSADATVDFTGASLDGVESGDTVSIDSTGYSASFDNASVGTGKPVTVTGVALSGADAGNYDISQPTGLTADISGKNLTVSGAQADNKVYDGNADATVDFSGASLNGVEPGETVTIDSTGYSASFNDKNVGNGKTVTVTGVALSGPDAGNYTLTQPSLTANITKKDTTGSFTANSRPYDGTDDATIDTATVDGKESGDDVQLTGTAKFADENVGAGKTVTLTSPILTGADAGNYNLTTVSTTTADITKKNLTVSGAVANNKPYDGNADATVDFAGASLNGVESGDTVTIDSTGYSASFNNEDAGNGKPVTVTGVALSGADNGNYSVSQPSGLTANITKKGLTISGAQANNKVYNGNDGATVDFTGASLNGVESGDTVSIDSTGYSASFNNKNVADGKPVTVLGVALGGADNGNYSVSQPTGLTADITKKDTTGSFTANNKPYDGTDDATIDTATVDGKESGDDVQLTGTAKFADENVGAGKTVTLTSPILTGADAGNYNLTTVSTTTADITKKGLTISGAQANNRAYNGNTNATVDFTGASLNGVESGDTVSIDSTGYSASFNNKNVANGKPVTVSGVALSGADQGNYSVSQPTGLTADITKKDTTGSFTANNKPYDGTDDATVNTATVDGKETGDTVNLTGTAKFDNENAGTGKTVTLTSPSLTGGDAGNYNLTTVSTTTADITKKGLTISGAQANNRAYNGNTNATVDFTGASLNGVVSGDTVSIDSTGYSASFNNENVGNGKPVTVTGVALGGADAGNYSVSQPSGLTANITAKGLTVSGAQANNRVYDGNATATVDFTGASLNGVESGDTVTIDSSGYSALFNNKNVANGKPVTVSGVALGGADNGNYTVSQPSGLTANITKKDTTGSFTANNKPYDGTDDATINTATVNAKETGDTVNLTGTAKFNTKNVGTAKTVTLTSPSLTGADANNYNLTTVSTTTADITAKGLTISGAQANNKVYNGNPNATVDFTGASLTGVESGDSVTIDSSGYSASFNNKNVGNGKPATGSGVALSGADAGNYTVSQPSGLTANITKKDTTGSFTANSKPYDGTDDASVNTATVDAKETGDTVNLAGTAKFNNKNVGTGKTVTLTSPSLTGTDAGNYNLTTISTTTADITVKSVTGGFTAANKVYDGNAGATVSNRSLSGAVSGDDVSLSGGSASFANENVGTGKTVTLSGASLAGADQGNYTLGSVSTDTADITRKSVTGSITAADKDFDGTNAATITGRSLNGAIAGDLVALVGGTATFADANPGVGKTVTGTGFALGGAEAGNYTLGSVGTTTATIRQRDPEDTDNPPTQEELEQDAADKLGGDVNPIGGLSFNGMGFAFAPSDQGGSIPPANQNLFGVGCTADCNVDAGKNLVLTGQAGASAAASKTIKLKTQKLSLAEGEIGVIKLKLTKKQKKAIKKAKKAKLVVKVTITSGGETVTDKKTYRLKAKNG